MIVRDENGRVHTEVTNGHLVAPRDPDIIFPDETIMGSWGIFLHSGVSPVTTGSARMFGQAYDDFLAGLQRNSRPEELDRIKQNVPHAKIVRFAWRNWPDLSRVITPTDQPVVVPQAYPEVNYGKPATKGSIRPDIMAVDAQGVMWVGEAGAGDKEEKLASYRELIQEEYPGYEIRGFTINYVVADFYMSPPLARVDLRVTVYQ